MVRGQAEIGVRKLLVGVTDEVSFLSIRCKSGQEENGESVVENNFEKRTCIII